MLAPSGGVGVVGPDDRCGAAANLDAGIDWIWRMVARRVRRDALRPADQPISSGEAAAKKQGDTGLQNVADEEVVDGLR